MSLRKWISDLPFGRVKLGQKALILENVLPGTKAGDAVAWQQVGSFVFTNPTITKSTVTQITSITTGVTANASAGVITTVALTTAAGASESPFTVTNSAVLLSSVIGCQVEYANGKTGFPVILIEAVTTGSFKVRIKNITTGVEALNDVIKIHFVVL